VGSSFSENSCAGLGRVEAFGGEFRSADWVIVEYTEETAEGDDGLDVVVLPVCWQYGQ
jgi:hypothetical protein